MNIVDRKIEPTLPKLLLVDDDVAVQSVVKSILEKEGFEIITANSGKSAIELVKLNRFTAVISDIHMPDTDGLELLKYIRQEIPALPVILMTGFTNLHETKEAVSLGARGFLAKPFSQSELMQTLNGIVPATKSLNEPSGEVSESFCRINIDEFISGKNISYPIFLKLGTEKYIKIAHRGEDVKVDRIQAFKAKGIEHLHIKSKDFGLYVGFNLTLNRAAKKSRVISQQKKIELAKYTSVVILENIFINGVSEEAFSQAKEITETTISLLSECPETFDILAALRDSGDHLYAHSLGVSLYSSMIAKQVGWTTPATLFKVSTAGLFHDIGMKELDKSLSEKSRSLLTIDEIRQLETHPARAADILRGIPAIGSEILQAVLQHHESGDGHGYPAKLTRGKIIPLASLLSVADEFCELALASPNSPGFSAREAMDRLISVSASALDSKFMIALQAVLKLEPIENSVRKGGMS